LTTRTKSSAYAEHRIMSTGVGAAQVSGVVVACWSA
jgi:hypothetical protein